MLGSNNNKREHDITNLLDEYEMSNSAQSQVEEDERERGVGFADPNKVRSKKKTVSKFVVLKYNLKQWARSFSILFMILVLLYAVSASTGARVLPSYGTDAGFVPVKNNMYPGGKIPSGETIAIDSSRGAVIERDMISRLKYGFIPTNTLAVVQVIAGPYGKIQKSSSQFIAVDSVALNMPLELPSNKKFLEGEYIVKCVKGACGMEAAFIINEEQVYGTVISKDKAKLAAKKTGEDVKSLPDSAKDLAGSTAEKIIPQKTGEN